MEGEPEGFWGKLRRTEDRTVSGWHPLEHHCADVAACCEALLQRTLLPTRLASLIGIDHLSQAQVARLSVLAAYHDIGKFNLGFQNKALLYPPFPPNGHVREVLALFDGRFGESEKFRRALVLDEIGTWGPENAPWRLLIASIAHHGRPASIDGSTSKFRESQWKAARGLDPFEGIARLAERSRSWFPAAFAANADSLPAEPAFQHAFSGLVTLADWIASDTRFFPYSDDPETDRIDFARGATRRALSGFGIDTLPARHSLGSSSPSFSLVSSLPPRKFQQAIIDLPSNESGSLTILEAETGSGKTEAALALFVKLLQVGAVDGMYFALPTRTAATQIHERVRKAVQHAFPDEQTRPPVALGVPGYLLVDDREGQRLPGFEVLWNDDEKERYRFRGWAAENPKRYLAGPITVGTIDQVLLSTLMVSHAHMRCTALMRHLLVVDEVHASDAYMIRILREVLTNQLQAGGHALLMSATLGSAARAQLLTSRSGATPTLESLPEAKQFAYPSLVYSGDGGVTRLWSEAGAARKVVRHELRPWSEDVTSIAKLAVDSALAGARVLVVRNTVADCVATQREVEREADARMTREVLFASGATVAPHHARFAAQDRRSLDTALETRFGKDPSDGACIAVATQTIQQSLDIDADLLITDLCPMDVLLQRVGRLHRHPDRSRPSFATEPRIVVVTPGERDLTPLIRAGGEARGPHGFGTVYEDLQILEATWRALEAHETLVVPHMNRELVENATHPEALKRIVNELGGAWREHATKVFGSTFAQTRLAKLNCIDRTIPFGDSESEFPSKELERRIQTRLGEGDRIAQFPEPLSSPFGNTISALTIPAYLARGVDSETQAQVTSADSAAIEFSLGPHRFIYDRLGLRHAEQSNDEDFQDG